MGNSNLRDIASIDKISEEEYNGSTVAVDTFEWLYKYMMPMKQYMDTGQYTTDDGIHELPNIPATLKGLPRFVKHNLKPVFVFDGTSHSLKEKERKKRRESRTRMKERAEDARENGEYQKASRLEAQSSTLTPKMVETTRTLLERLNIPCVDADDVHGEGEAQAAHMTQNGSVDYVITNDYDALLFGATQTLRNFTGKKSIECMEFERTLSDTGLSYDQLIDIGILCGTDFNPGGVPYVGPERAMRYINEYGDIHTVLDEKDKELPNVDELRAIFHEGSSNDAYIIPKSIKPDVKAADSYISDTLGLNTRETKSNLEYFASVLN